MDGQRRKKGDKFLRTKVIRHIQQGAYEYDKKFRQPHRKIRGEKIMSAYDEIHEAIENCPVDDAESGVSTILNILHLLNDRITDIESRMVILDWTNPCWNCRGKHDLRNLSTKL